MKKICLVCSSGGHFMQMQRLEGFWGQYSHRFWVSFKAQDTGVLLQDETAYWAYSPTNRHVINMIRNFFLAIRLLKKEKPEAVVSTGAGLAVPFIYAAKCLGIKTIYVESLTRVNGLSLSGRMIYKVVDHLFVQWPEMAERYPKALFRGQVL